MLGISRVEVVNVKKIFPARSSINTASLRRLLASLFVLFAVSSSCMAQDYDSVRSIYVKEFPDYFNGQIIATDRLLILNLIGREGEKSRINYAPNDRGYIGLAAYVFDVGIGLSVKVPAAFERDKDKYGSTDFIDLQGNIYGKKWCFDGTFQKYEGFFLNNAVDITPGFESGDNFPQRADLGVMNIIINGIYILNHQKFSFRSGFNQADKQIKSAGSPILLLSASRFGINADSVLIPDNVADDFGNLSEIVDGRFITMSVLPGYAYNLVFRDLFVNINATAGIGLQHQKLDLGNDSRAKYAIEPRFNFRAALGYDNERFFAGASFLLQRSTINMDGMRINNIAGNYKFFVGYRFKEFGILKKYSIYDVKLFK